MRIPEIADRLREMAAEQGLPELDRLAASLRRRSPKRKAAARSTPMTAELEARIRAFVRANPGMSQVEVGRVFSVNQGRVSEALRGKRK